MPEFQLRSAETGERFRQSLEQANVSLPVRIASEDEATVIDDGGRLVCVVDVNRERSDSEASQIALWIVLALNTCGGFSKVE